MCRKNRYVVAVCSLVIHCSVSRIQLNIINPSERIEHTHFRILFLENFSISHS